MVGLRQKVMGQVNLVLAGLNIISDGGSFTLTSGVLDRDPIRMGANAATANGALAGFVKSAAIEMPRGLREKFDLTAVREVARLRNQLGHPSLRALVHSLPHAGVDVQYLLGARAYQCADCLAAQLPQDERVASALQANGMNRAV